MADGNNTAQIAAELTLMVLEQAFEAKEVKIEPKIQGLQALAENTAEVYKILFKAVAECLEEEANPGEVTPAEEEQTDLEDESGHGDEEQYQEEKGYGDDTEKVEE
ncbi:hypothetical protein [Desulforamulus ruminis]|uniref:Uncharacterized protein n=1 Tax=Desulforamulus ruminis (strain ATCC 23193 / DSM 2154 / NCIMB 8452 / DL) TaxID=696281 RepID=F6DTA5_DESRL|nr:hypothetical protein [Desulforamulus ruminis]AEG58922.1 hypothetical protein Desru_0637 [Desulforamulus ruminis DSM 2154]